MLLRPADDRPPPVAGVVIAGVALAVAALATLVVWSTHLFYLFDPGGLGSELPDRVVGAGRVEFRTRPASRTLDDMHTRRRASYRASHHPHVHCEGGGRWRWACACGARGWSLAGGWQSAYTAALVHQSMSPGE